jgi:PPM family protein phosphatase
MDVDDRPGVIPYTESREFPPLSASVEVTFGAHSGCGRMHALNEDHYIVVRLGRHQETLMTSLPDDLVSDRFDESGYAMVVADGLGESGAGEHASRLAVATLMHLALHFGKWNLRIDDKIAQEVMQRAERFYRHVDSAVAHQAKSHPGARLETTLTAVFGAGRDLFFAHVGHSRAYLFRELTLMRLTRDHTVAERQSWNVPVGPLVDVNLSARDLRHIITETIGMAGTVGPTIDLERVQLMDGDRVLVCTNGLTDTIDESRIGEVLASGASPNEQSRILVELAMAAGAEDDATALVALYRIPA